MRNGKFDVVVVGGGPAGLAAAIAARTRGFTSVVLESACPPLDKACGEGLMPDGLAALHRLGVHPERADSSVFRGIRFLDGGVSVEGEFTGGKGIGIRRTILHELLVTRARDEGVELGWGTRVTGLAPGGVRTATGTIFCRWVVGADGLKSPTREWAGLDSIRYEHRRFGYRQHFEVAPWTDTVEVYWGARCQVVITPVGSSRICAALVSPDPKFHVADAVASIPALARRLGGTRTGSAEKGAITAVRVLRKTACGRFALVGDASGSVDAITGQGLCLSFRQAVAFGEALESGSMRTYEAAHRRFARKPVLMSRFMLAMDRFPQVRSVAMRLLAAGPSVFAGLVNFHVGGSSTRASQAPEQCEAFQ